MRATRQPAAIRFLPPDHSRLLSSQPCPALDSVRHELLQRLAEQHAAYMARVNRQGHQGFQGRWDIVHAELGFSATEICAESWPEQRDLPEADLLVEAVKCWRQSPGHWRVAGTRHKFSGVAIGRGRRVAYIVCLVAD